MSQSCEFFLSVFLLYFLFIVIIFKAYPIYYSILHSVIPLPDELCLLQSVRFVWKISSSPLHFYWAYNLSCVMHLMSYVSLFEKEHSLKYMVQKNHSSHHHHIWSSTIYVPHCCHHHQLTITPIFSEYWISVVLLVIIHSTYRSTYVVFIKNSPRKIC